MADDKFIDRLKFYLEGEPPERVIAVIKNIQYVYWQKVIQDFEEIIKQAEIELLKRDGGN